MTLIDGLDKNESIVSINALGEDVLDINGAKLNVKFEHNISSGTKYFFTMRLQRKYLVDALKGMSKEFVLKFQARNAPLLFENEKDGRKAIVMPFGI